MSCRRLTDPGNVARPLRVDGECSRLVARDHLPLITGVPRIMNRHPVGPYSRAMPRVIGVSRGAGRFVMGEVPL